MKEGQNGRYERHVKPADLAQVADELYALAPAEFRSARDERADQARAAGDRGLAGAIKKLRRPTVSAWLVNQLARQAADQIAELLELGEQLRQAQQSMAADQLRQLSAQRRRKVVAVTEESKRLAAQARQSFSVQVEREVEATLEAALADPSAADAVRSGRLTSALSYAGLGGIDLSDAVAVPSAPSRPGQPSRGGQKPTAGRAEPTRQAAQRSAEAAGDTAESAVAQRKAREAERARQDLADADEAVDEARAALDEAERQVVIAGDEHRAVQREIEELEQRLDQAQQREATIARAVRDARRSRDAVARALQTAERRLARAQAKAKERA